MRYSQIVGECFYQIKLSQPERNMLDLFFTGAGHHYWRAREAFTNGDRLNAEFHLEKMQMHVESLRAVIYFHGDFSQAVDQSWRGLEKRASWDPASRGLPDPEMFNSFSPDFRFKVGDNHPNDQQLPDYEEEKKQTRMAS